MISLIKATKSQSEMRDVATRICREYLSGAWKTISSDEIQVKRISGGLSNFLYYVSLPTSKKDTIATKRTRKDSYHNALEPIPCSVLLRIYGQTHGEHALETMLTESVVFALLSERQLGPKLHGIFPGGRIEQYIPARSLTTAELANNQISLKIAEKMSEIHSLDIPVSKEPDWLFLTLNRWLNNVETIMNDVKNNNNNDDENDPKDLPKKLSKIDFRKETEWLRKVIESEDCPVVFCHNDMQEGNILFRQNHLHIPEDDPIDGDLTDLSPLLISTPKKVEEIQEILTTPTNGNSRKRSLVDSSLDSDFIDSTTGGDDSMGNEKPELMIIDFEYCAYNYRAFDIANHFLEWTYDYTNDKFPYFYHRRENYPTSKQMDDFITVYLSHRTNDGSTPSPQDKDQLLKEIALFSLASHMFWGIWGIVNINQDIEFGYWEYANLRITEYFAAKEKYFEIKPHAREICDLETRRK